MTPRRVYRGRRVTQTTAGYQQVARKEKQEAKDTPRSRRRMLQLIISAIILVSIVGVKLLAPNVLAYCREHILPLIGENTDFTEAFSSVGRAVSGEGGLTDALQDAYQAVFGSADDVADTSALAAEIAVEDAAMYTAENLPEDAFLFQRVLGFPYADPVAGKLTSAFGNRVHPVSGEERFHYGIDIDVAEGTVIRSFADGKVTAVGESAELGKYVTVQHANDFSTLYAHCQRITASSGQTVQLGDPIAESGATGQTTGPHLHFELHQDTVCLNPIYYVSH